ncbi:ribonuclease J [Natranaerobius thermophilus]|uniref:Ribonuclease J n=1 Tax=Natranaerobius thermophilus (strain ATCC BAA-1301 / DSM 18059 / JW/NM-WN-LF) TaxID=457570 RepID=B2A3B3_NATTJ|nr:ribonuclease J [Natranaerobius thermophilus]ACB85043.1 beta-lactamase domain protein [Natranaerobius thermophilus JW/NM-WN-LF]
MSARKQNNRNGNGSRNSLQVIPLGGVGEIGKNMFVIKYGNDMIVIDAGLKFPDEDMLGVDFVIPDMSYLFEHKDNIKGIFLTHGHEDHIGALPYLMKKIDAPVYGTKLTLGLAERKLGEQPIQKSISLKKILPGKTMQLGPFKMEFFSTNHSIPDSIGIVVHTPEGTIVHTGDFKFDHTPVSGKVADYNKLAELGNKGVLCLLSDSTNAERPGYTESDRTVGERLDEIFRQAPKRIILATFASNIYRIQQVINSAKKYGKKVGVVGRSMINVIEAASELGYLENVDDVVIDDIERVNQLPLEKTVLLTTGSQGEPMSALTRIATDDHRKVEIMPHDTVVIAATPIPGNEKLISRSIDNLFKRGAHVIYQSVSGVHVSGHGSQEELKMMLNLVKPKYLIPFHGEYRMQVHHKNVAEKLGMPSKNVFLAENGEVIEFNRKRGKVNGKVPAGKVLVDGLGVGDVGNIVLRDRRLLSQDGILIVVIGVDKQNKTLIAGPDIVSRGFVYVRESEELLEEAREHVVKAVNKMSKSKMNEWQAIKSSVKDVLGQYLWEKTRRRPMILPIIMEV